MSELPQGWSSAAVAQLIAADGLFSDGNWVESKDQDPNGAIRLLQLADIGDGAFLDKSNRFINEEQFVRVRGTEIFEGDVLIARMPDPLGRACMTPPLTQQCITVVDVAIVRPGQSSVQPKWLMHFLNAPPTRQEIELLSSGTTRRRISRGNLAQIQLPLPPLNEQKRIADKLDAVLARVDSCRERLDRVPVILKRFRQAVLTAATSGALTEEWREENRETTPVKNNMLAKVEELRRTCVEEANDRQGPTRFRYKPAELIDLGRLTKGIAELFVIPESWAWASLGQLTWSVSDGPHFSPKYVDKKNGIPFISGRNITYRGIDFSDAKYISRKDHDEFCKRAQPLPGDVLLTKGGTTGIATVVEGPTEFSIWVHLALLKTVNEIVSPFYLKDALSAPFAYAQSQALTHGVGNQDLGLTRLVHIALPLPPLSEQTEIVRRVEALFALADRLEARYITARAQVDRLTPALLAKAFRGELVPQDPSDEPASELLARIQAARAAAPAKAKARRTRKTKICNESSIGEAP